jgi:hypothetical protein
LVVSEILIVFSLLVLLDGVHHILFDFVQLFWPDLVPPTDGGGKLS